MSVHCAPAIEAPLGYSLLERLGAGGYGEVWKATAPGGVEKAVKIVFGHCDEELAGRELKALQRIKSVRHPFLLTIERYEVVNHRLVIVSELADKSLEARFKEVQQEGLAGIPREELLTYLSDAAEALDWLSEHHSLQHLDVKPENLLIVGDHAKVADFGLVKDVATRTLNSLVGGMTPVYSAPEVYDDAPTRWSDQYSLAIVYQHMLTGTLPFPGRTPAQLAKQHMLATPNLSPLCETDRHALDRALQKKPEARFENCRQLVDALKQPSAPSPRSSTVVADVGRASLGQSDDDTQSSSALLTTPAPQAKPASPPVLPELSNSNSAPSVPKAVSYPPVRLEVIDAEPPLAPVNVVGRSEPTLFVGIGGVGLELLSRARDAMAAEQSDESRSAWLAMDTDFEELKSLGADLDRQRFSMDELLHIPLRRPKQYRECSQDLLKWLSRRWLYNIPRSLLTRGYRPLGRLAFVDHADRVLETLSRKIADLAQIGDARPKEPQTVRIVILSGASGGTGSGCAIDLGQAVRSAGRSLGVSTDVEALFGCTCVENHLDTLAAANMYSFLTELTHAQREGNQGENRPAGSAAYFELPKAPFDRASLIAIPSGNERTKRELVLQSLADYVAVDSRVNLASLATCVPESADAADEAFSLAAYACVNLASVARSLATTGVESLVSGFVNYCLEVSDDCEPTADELGELRQCRIASPLIVAIRSARGVENANASDEERLRREQNILAYAAASIGRVVELQRNLEPETAACVQATRRRALYEGLLAAICKDIALGKDIAGLSLEDWQQHLEAAASSDLDSEYVETACDDVILKLEGGLQRPLNCGCRRLRAIVDPAHEKADGIDQDTLRPMVASALAPGAPATYLLAVGAGIRPIHVGARLAESFPDIEEAAGRLHSRSDVPWRPLSDDA